jgi:hypothetical protein
MLPGTSSSISQELGGSFKLPELIDLSSGKISGSFQDDNFFIVGLSNALYSA